MPEQLEFTINFKLLAYTCTMYIVTVVGMDIWMQSQDIECNHGTFERRKYGQYSTRKWTSECKNKWVFEHRYFTFSIIQTVNEIAIYMIYIHFCSLLPQHPFHCSSREIEVGFSSRIYFWIYIHKKNTAKCLKDIYIKKFSGLKSSSCYSWF